MNVGTFQKKCCPLLWTESDMWSGVKSRIITAHVTFATWAENRLVQCTIWIEQITTADYTQKKGKHCSFRVRKLLVKLSHWLAKLLCNKVILKMQVYFLMNSTLAMVFHFGCELHEQYSLVLSDVLSNAL